MKSLTSGFSILSEDKNKPGILITPLDQRRQIIELKFPTKPKRESKRRPFLKGRFLDLHTFVFALRNENHSLASAGKAFKCDVIKEEAEEHGTITPQYLDYNLRDCLATLDLYCKAMEEFNRHPIGLNSSQAYSPASIGKAYYEAMGIVPFMKKKSLPPEVLGHAMESYFGGRSEVKYRLKPVPCFHVDFVSMYPSVFTLQDLWKYVIADNFDVKEVTEEIRCFLDNLNPEDLFRKETWLDVPALVCVKPEKDILPVRANYGQKKTWNIGHNYFTCPYPLWFTLADCMASKLLTGKMPNVIKAYRVIPVEPQKTLKAIKLEDLVLDPAKDNFFKKIIETRKHYKKLYNEEKEKKEKGLPYSEENLEKYYHLQYILKIIANATGYGIFVEENRKKLRKAEKIKIFGFKSFEDPRKEIEVHGKYFMPVIATFVTSGARLMLTLLEVRIRQSGGGYAFCDTDSMCIIDLKKNRPDEIGRKVIEDFKSLNPYAFEGSLLEAEDCNFKEGEKGIYETLYCYAVSAKRYVLYNYQDGKITIRKYSHHGLGHLLNPLKRKNEEDEKINEKWHKSIWEHFIKKAHGIKAKWADWVDLPAFSRYAVSKPSIYKKVSREEGKDWPNMVKPFGFILIAHPLEDSNLKKSAVEPFYCRKRKSLCSGHCKNKELCKPYREKCFANCHIMPITPFRKNLEDWQNFSWFDKVTKEPLNLRQYNKNLDFDVLYSSDDVFLKNYYEYVNEYIYHPELKFDDKKGNACDKFTTGQLKRTHIIVKDIGQIKLIGKETNTIQEPEEIETLPDELELEDRYMIYEESKSTKGWKVRLTKKDEEEVRHLLSKKAKPRNVWAEKFGISERYLNQIIQGTRIPSPSLYEKIIKELEYFWEDESLCTPTNIIKENVYKLKEIINLTGKTKEEIEKYMSCFPLYGIDYVCITDESLFNSWKKEKRQRDKERIQAEMKNLTIKGVNLESKEVCCIPLESLTHFQFSRWQGRKNPVVNVKADGRLYSVFQEDNPLVFTLKLLPKFKDLNPDFIKVKKYPKRNLHLTKLFKWPEDLPNLTKKQVEIFYPGYDSKELNPYRVWKMYNKEGESKISIGGEGMKE